MIKVIPYTPAHLKILRLNQGYDPSVLENYGNMDGFLCETIVKDRRGDFEVLAVLSGALIMAGNFEVSALVGDNAKKYPLEFFRTVKSRIENYEMKLDLRRVQCTVRDGFPFLVKFIKMLGFEREGLMRKFGPEGDDYYLYARVK